MKKGTAVEYDTGHGETLALVLRVGEATEHDLVVFDAKDGNSTVVKGVPRRDEGGGKTWKPV